MTVRSTSCALGAAAILLACASQPSAQGGSDSSMVPVPATATAGAPAADAPASAPAAPAGEGQQRVASPRDTAEATVGGARVMVDYGRPSKRGREIYGNLVPTNRVWRTGANAATTLVTAAPLRVGSTTIPAGTYTLYSLWTGSAWNLIVNKQTGQWGTAYDQKQDLARIPMQVKSVSSPVEQFTIAVEPSGQNGGVLSMAWDTKRGELPFTVAR